jgi:hypothetical protein
MSKAHKKLIADTIARWRETILYTGRGDVDAAKKLIHSVHKNANVFVVDTPAQFYIAQAILRRRISKKFAVETVCPSFGIAADFVNDLRAIGGPVNMINGQSWSRRSTKNLFDRAWVLYLNNLFADKLPDASITPATTQRLINGRSRWWVQNDNAIDRRVVMAHQMCDLHALYHSFGNNVATKIKEEVDTTGKTDKLGFNAIAAHLAFHTNSRMVENSCLTLAGAVSNAGVDIVNGNYDCSAHSFDATQAEMLCRITNCKKPEVNICHEIFHYVPAIMHFRSGFLLLAERPKIALNGDGILHSETGQAIMYRDGTGFWYLEGHMLRQAGRQIVMSPETLDGKTVENIENEEERRIAIDRLGWEKYLSDIDAKVLDSRENWIDNTIEVLFATPPRQAGREEQLRTLLSCRSTGRRYFMAVPSETENSWFRRHKSIPIKTCEDVQKWMANGAKCDYLPYASHDVRVIGAS